MYVLGTAGHVDHGKSLLVQALTGIDPDRLAEEKERGLTIELGFAWLTLPSGRETSIVDVPGHERFVKNMLAGVGGIDVALLIIAADEGVMPQTREHLAILDLLDISHGLVVITKKDLVDQEMLELVTMDIEEVLKDTVLEGTSIITTSALTGEGLGELVEAIDGLLEATPQRRDIGRPRLSIDRVFTIKGFGTVVTGTLIDGRFSIGQQVEIVPGGQRASIRGLETHKKKLETALPGTRVAMNLSSMTVEALEKGFVVTTPGWLSPSKFLDLKLRASRDLSQSITHNKAVTFHTGAAEIPGKVRLLDAEKLNAGESGWAQMALNHPVAAANGDPFIIRSASGTLGGGKIIDARARRHRRFSKEVIESLQAREKGTPEDIINSTLQANEPAEFSSLLASCSLSAEEATRTIDTMIAENRLIKLGPEGPKALLFSREGWTRLMANVQKVMQSYHNQFPLRTGIPKEELRSRLNIPQQHFADALKRLAHEGILHEEGAVARAPAHEVSFSPKQQAEVDSFLESLETNPFSPSPGTLSQPELLNALIDKGKVVKLSENVIFAASAYDEMVKRITEHLKSEGKITVAQVRDMFGTSRKYALALMEHLDEQKVTRRIGDERVLR
ncbi:MAG: selenocysteine-specific translation elongation factor [Dehalococcoidia bacterium]